MDEENKIKNEEGGAHVQTGTAELEEKLAKAEKDRDEYLAGWQRAKADFINYKKDEMRRLEDLAKFGTEEFMKELITVLDTFDLGLATLEKQGPVDKGVYMIRAQFEDMLKRRGLSRIELKPGDPFDPMIAEAMLETESEFPEGAVVEEIEPGYALHEKVLRPARVKISKGKANG